MTIFLDFILLVLVSTIGTLVLFGALSQLQFKIWPDLDEGDNE